MSEPQIRPSLTEEKVPEKTGLIVFNRRGCLSFYFVSEDLWKAIAFVSYKGDRDEYSEEIHNLIFNEDGSKSAGILAYYFMQEEMQNVLLDMHLLGILTINDG